MMHAMELAGRRTAARSEVRFALVVALGYLAAATAAALVHEPWRDETRAWLLARDASGPLALIHDLRYDGHPALWHLCLWPLTRLGGPGLMQAAGVAFGAASAFVFAGFAPFPRAARALFPLGYLLVWEWGAIARNYGIGVLLLFVAATLFTERHRHPVLLGVVLALAMNTSAVAAITAAGLLLLLLVERLSPWRDVGQAAPPSRFWCGVSVAAAGLAACALQVAPPADSAIGATWNTRTAGERAAMALASPVHGLATVPWGGALERWPWLNAAQIAVAVVVTVALAITAALALARRRGAWIAAAAPVVALLALFFFRYYGGARHAGFLLVSLLLAVWVAPTFPRRADRTGAAGAWAERNLGLALTAAFGFQVLGTGIQAAIDGPGVYSAARDTAALIRTSGLAALPVVADPDYLAANVIAFLGQRAAFYENVQRWGSYDVWDSRHAPDRPNASRASDAAVFARAVAFADRNDVLVLIDREADATAVAGARARCIGSRRADVRKDESFWVYLVPRH